jgi:hypothetical protein
LEHFLWKMQSDDFGKCIPLQYHDTSILKNIGFPTHFKIFKIANKSMNGDLLVIPMKSLCSILNNKWIIFQEIPQNNNFSILKWMSLLYVTAIGWIFLSVCYYINISHSTDDHPHIQQNSKEKWQVVVVIRFAASN